MNVHDHNWDIKNFLKFICLNVLVFGGIIWLMLVAFDGLSEDRVQASDGKSDCQV